MTEATLLDRFDAAFARIEAGLAAERSRRERAERRYALLESASADAIEALDTLLHAPEAR